MMARSVSFTCNGHDWTKAYRRVIEACARLACETAVIDGEMVVQDEHGLTDFNALRRHDLRRRPLMERRALLGG